LPTATAWTVRDDVPDDLVAGVTARLLAPLEAGVGRRP